MLTDLILKRAQKSFGGGWGLCDVNREVFLAQEQVWLSEGPCTMANHVLIVPETLRAYREHLQAEITYYPQGNIIST